MDDVAKSLTLEEALLKENGGYNIANAYINMNFNNIRNVGNPQNNTDAVPKKYVDNVVDSIKKSINKKALDILTTLTKTSIERLEKRKHIITASASYHGDLIAGDYQFTWGGQSVASYKKHDMFNGFLVPSNGRIKRFILLETGIKFNTPPNVISLLDYITNDVGYNNPFPLFTLVLIRQNQEPIDIETLYFHFENREGNISTTQSFKFNPNFEEETLRTVKQKDIINIRSEFNSIELSKHTIPSSNTNYRLFDFKNEFFTYLATVLIELDPLDD